MIRLLKIGRRGQGGYNGAAVRESNNRIRYGGPWFSAASDLPLERDQVRLGYAATLVAAAVRRPRRVVALFAVLLGTRSEDVFLSGSSPGEALREYFNQRSLGVFPQNRLCRGVLLLPSDHSEYLRGRRRQALRTNLRRAAAAGIVCEEISDPAAALDAASEVFRTRRASFSDKERHTLETDGAFLFARPEATVMVARDRSGRPLALTAAVIDDTVCLIALAVASNHEARWALHDHLVRMLIGRGVTYLLADGGGRFGALGLDGREQYYQHLLGYELRHLVPVPPQAMSRRRRRVASVVAASIAALSLLLPSSSAGASAALAQTPLLACTPAHGQTSIPRDAPARLPTAGGTEAATGQGCLPLSAASPVGSPV
jgi:hypothetical protein